MQGFDGFLNSKDILRKKSRNFKPEDRLFSLSSKTSPVVGGLRAPSCAAAACPVPLHKLNVPTRVRCRPDLMRMKQRVVSAALHLVAAHAVWGSPLLLPSDNPPAPTSTVRQRTTDNPGAASKMRWDWQHSPVRTYRACLGPAEQYQQCCMPLVHRYPLSFPPLPLPLAAMFPTSAPPPTLLPPDAGDGAAGPGDGGLHDASHIWKEGTGPTVCPNGHKEETCGCKRW